MSDCTSCKVSPPRRIVQRIREPTPEPIIQRVVVRLPTPVAGQCPKASPCGTESCRISPPRRHVERIREPTPDPIIKRIVTRLKTPEPRVIYVAKPPDCSQPSLPPPPPPQPLCSAPQPACGNHCKVSPPRRHVERIRDATPEPIVKRIVNRLPTPEPDIIERVIIKRQPQVIIEKIFEQPRPHIPPAPLPLPKPACHAPPPPQPVCSAPQPSCGNECRVSPPRRHVERIRDSTPEPIIKRIVNRLPTPEPDIIERIIVKRQPQVIIEKITERPRSPPPIIIQVSPCDPRLKQNAF